MNERQLLELKENMASINQEISELKGKKKLLVEQLKTQFKCETIMQAKKMVKDLKRDAHKIQNTIDEGLAELEEELNDG